MSLNDIAWYEMLHKGTSGLMLFMSAVLAVAIPVILYKVFMKSFNEARGKRD